MEVEPIAPVVKEAVEVLWSYARKSRKRAEICNCPTCVSEANDINHWFFVLPGFRSRQKENKKVLTKRLHKFINVNHYGDEKRVPPEEDTNINNWGIDVDDDDQIDPGADLAYT